MSQPNPGHGPRTHFETVCPVFRVHDLAASLDYYTKVLGFALDWEQYGVASVSRDNACLFLCQGDQGNPGAWVSPDQQVRSVRIGSTALLK